MTTKIVAYGPVSSEIITVPEYLIIRDSQVFLLAKPKETTMCEVSLSNMLSQGTAVMISPYIEWKFGEWLVIEDNKCRLVTNSELDKWKIDKSVNLLNEAKLEVDLEKRVGKIKTSASVAGVNLDQLLSDLEKLRTSPEETLEELFKKASFFKR
jgi:hypothetical protein